MKFKFKEIKQFKQILKEKEEVLLVSIVREKEDLLNQVKDKENEYRQIQTKIRSLYSSDFNISLVRLYNDNLELTLNNIKELKIKVDKVNQRIEEQKNIIKAATIEFKKFEKLEENYIKEKRELLKYNEKKELDEIVSIREFHKN